MPFAFLGPSARRAVEMAWHVHAHAQMMDRSEDRSVRSPTRMPAIKVVAAITAFASLSGCVMQQGGTLLPPGQPAAVRDAQAIENSLDRADVVTAQQIVPSISGVGYATISAQPATNVNQRRLMAIRAARIDAMRDLTEQVHGLKLNSQTTVINALVQNDTSRAAVDGTIRGARTVRINPVGRDTYEVVLELDRDMITRIMRALR